MGLKPGMMDLGAVALRVADGGTTKAFDRTEQPVKFVFNPKTPDKAKVLSHVIVVNSENVDTLLGIRSILGKIGMSDNLYKGRVGVRMVRCGQKAVIKSHSRGRCRQML
jgi:hypothetical protein